MVTETRTVTVEKEIIVPVPASLTKQVEEPTLSDNPDTLELGAAYKQMRTRLRVANGKLQEIERLVK